MGIRLFVNTSFFDKCWESLGLGDEDLRNLQNLLLVNLIIGDIIEDTGGVRKARWNLGTGKSHGARVIYLDLEKQGRVYCLMAYPKNVKDDLTVEDKKVIRNLVNDIEIELEKWRIKESDCNYGF